MSKDIRSFFKIQSSQKTKPAAINLSDDDVIPESPEVVIAKKRKPKARAIFNDSSDEEPTNKILKPSSKSKEKTTPNSKHKKDIKKDLKEVKPSEIFGHSKIKRTEPMVKSEKKKLKTETGIHSDEELEKTLLELDFAEEVQNTSTNDVINETIINDKDKTITKHKTPTKSVNKVKKQNKNDKNLVAEELSTTTPKKEIIKEILVKDKNININNDKLETPIKNTNKLESSKINDRDLNKSASKAKTPKQIKEEIKNENKRTFSEFIDETKSVETHKEDNENDEQESKNKKRKLNKTLNESVISDEERFEKKRYSAALYQNYLNRSGPKHLGTKEMPEGAPNCLKDCAFLLTGVLDSFEREEITETINKYGGCVKNGVSKKVTHVLAGEDAGPAKLAKALDLNIKVINEDEFLQMILKTKKKNHDSSIKDKKKKFKTTPIKKSDVEKVKSENHVVIKSDKDSLGNESNLLEDNVSNKDLKIKTDKVIPKKNKTENQVIIKSETVTPEKKLKSLEDIVKKNFYHKTKTEKVTPDKKIEKVNDIISNGIPTINDAQIWVEKHKPQNVKQIIGQHGDASNVKKLTNWLSKWYLKRKEKIPKPSPWAKSDDGGYFKAALLSGPPGVGKTTTVSLVCKELGFDTVEFNASDTRSKTLIKEQISDLLTTSSLSAFAKGDTGKQAVTKKHVLVMDEVDGMAGNEDRGGLQELISLIKTTAVPIICMCNDRNSTKMRSLVNYCYDLKFSRPRVDQIKSAMLSVCYKEGIKISPAALSQIIVGANQDVRQTLNLLSMWSVNCKQMDADQVTKDSNNAKKDIKLGPWEAVRKVFSAEEHKTMSIIDRSDLFFYDYSIAPLFVQENYLQVTPKCPKGELLNRLSLAADSISMGDLIEKKIRERNTWSLLPVQAMYSSVIPGHHMSGYVSGQIQFPGWLGKNSSRNKMKRLCQEIHAHTRLTTSGSKSSIYLDYCTHLRDAIITPLIKHKTDGVASCLEVLQSYNLLRDDLDSLTTLSLWPGQRDPMVMVDSKVKAAMTRTYNKEAMALPYAPGTVKRARDTAEDVDLLEDDDDVQKDNGEQSDSDPEHDALIKKKKKTVEKNKDDKPSSRKGAGKKGKSQKKS